MTTDALESGLAASVEFAGERLTLLADRAMWWPAQRTLLVADLHLGKPASFRAAGAPVPERVTAHDLDRLAGLIARHDARRLVMLGDLAHDHVAWQQRTLDAFAAWRDQHDAVEIVLVRGNHDRWAKDPPPELHIDAVDPGWRLGPIAMHHEPVESESPILCGHVHPGVALRGRRASAGLRAPCFWFTQTRGVLPAFGSFTGCAVVRPARGDRVFAIGDGRVIEIPGPA